MQVYRVHKQNASGRNASGKNASQYCKGRKNASQFWGRVVKILILSNHEKYFSRYPKACQC